MNKKLNKAYLTSQMKKQNKITKQWVPGTGCLVQPGKLYFFEEGNI